MPRTATIPGRPPFTPGDPTPLMIDRQPQITFATRPIDAVLSRNDVALVAAARGFGVPAISTTVADKTFSLRLLDGATCAP